MRAIAHIVALAVLTGCALGGARGPAPVVVAASPAAVGSASAVVIDRQLLVALPTASAMLSGTRVLARPQPETLAYLTGVAWPDAAPRMLQDQIVEALQRDGSLRAVERQGSGLRGDLALAISLHRLEIDYSTQPAQARVEFVATVIDAIDGVARVQRRFLAQRVADAGAATADARQLQVLLAQQIGELSGWLREVLPALVQAESSETSG